MSEIALWIIVRADDWTAEMSTTASNEKITTKGNYIYFMFSPTLDCHWIPVDLFSVRVVTSL